MSTSFKSVHGILSICTPPRQGFGDSSFKTPKGLAAKQQQRSSTRSLFNSPRTARRTPADRFIPTRTGTNAEFSSHSLSRSISKSMNRLDRAGREGDEDPLQNQLLELEGCSSDTRMLNFTPVKTKPRKQNCLSLCSALFSVHFASCCCRRLLGKFACSLLIFC